MIATDERGFYPSASSMDSELRCLGKRALMAKHHNPTTEKKESEDAKKGTRIHKVLEGTLSIEELSDSDKWTVGIIMNQEAEALSKYEFEGAAVVREKRIWYVDDLMNPRFSGKLDAYYILGNKALISDYKSGFSFNVPLDKNWQLKTQAVLVQFENENIETFTCILIHPLHPDSLREEITYTRAQVDGFRRQMLAGLDEGMIGGAPRTPSYVSCKYCPVKFHCTEFQDEMKRMLSENCDINAMTPKQRGEHLKFLKLAESKIKEEKETCKALLKADPMAIIGWRLKTSNMRDCTDNKRLLELARNAYTNESVEEYLELSFANLVEMAKAKSPEKMSKKKAEEAAEMMFGKLFKKTPKQPSLEETDERDQEAKNANKA